jgi:hypothetical protein
MSEIQTSGGPCGLRPLRFRVMRVSPGIYVVLGQEGWRRAWRTVSPRFSALKDARAAMAAMAAEAERAVAPPMTVLDQIRSP